MLDRKYSLTSSNYLETLDKLEVKFHEIIEKIWNLEKLTVDPSTTRDKVVRFQAELAQLYGDLDKFQVPFSLLFISFRL
jgi:Fe-S-cluster formation regulator IscX/YfhJ